MRHTEDGTLVDIPVVRPATHPRNMKMEDTLMNRTYLSVAEQDLLRQCLSNYITDGA